MAKRKVKVKKIGKILLLVVMVICAGVIYLFANNFSFFSDNISVDKKNVKKVEKKVAKDYSAKMLMVGDALIHSAVYEDARQADGTYDFTPMLSVIKPISSQYDFVIVNEVVGRSIDVVDTNYQDWICNSCVYEDVGQFIRARFSPERKYLLKSIKPTITIDVQLSEIPAIYYDWHTVPELRELLKKEPLYDDTGKAFLIWNQARKFYEDKLEFRRYGKKQVSQYRFKSSS